VTSADACIRFRRRDGLLQTVLIEWKYTECYPLSTDKRAENKLAGPGGRTRLGRQYRAIYDDNGGPIDPAKVEFEDLFWEPLYQLMRQQMLAHRMERDTEGDRHVVTVLHISPAHNLKLEVVTADRLAGAIRTSPWLPFGRNFCGLVPTV